MLWGRTQPWVWERCNGVGKRPWGCCHLPPPRAKAAPTPLRLELRCRRCPSAAVGAMAGPCPPPEVTVPVPSPAEAMLFTPATSPVLPPPPLPVEENTGEGY